MVDGTSVWSRKEGRCSQDKKIRCTGRKRSLLRVARNDADAVDGLLLDQLQQRAHLNGIPQSKGPS